MSENTNECVIEWIPGRDYVGLTAKNGSTWKNRCEELEKKFPDDVKILPEITMDLFSLTCRIPTLKSIHQENIPMKRKRRLRKD